jgi:hypothetical protein
MMEWSPIQYIPDRSHQHIQISARTNHPSVGAILTLVLFQASNHKSFSTLT